jgi:DNA-binding NarL/FixJ family response regulator
MTVRVVVADDHPMYRYGLAAVLAQHNDIEVVASVGDGDALLRSVDEYQPDVVVTDLSMPTLDGVAATSRLVATRPELAVLVLTMHEDDEHVFAALRAGARGYLVKGADGAQIVRAVQSVASGDAVYGTPVARRIIAFFAGEQAGPSSVRAFPDLTPRERDVLELLAAGCRNHEIARRLGMSEKTVRNHVSQVLLKLQVPDRTAAALKAREAGVGHRPDRPHDR